MNNHFSDIIYTRYLYIKDEVRVALLVSILNKSDDAIFWGYELYYSGFQIELFELIVKIYYDFFATLNPSFEQYLLQKKKYFTCSTEPPDNDGLVSELIQDLLFRPFNTDIFLIRNIAEHFEIDITYYEQIENEMNLLVNLRNWINYSFLLNDSGFKHKTTIYNNINYLNVHEIPDMVRMAHELRVCEIQLIPTHKFDNTDKKMLDILPNTSNYKQFLQYEAEGQKLAKELNVKLNIYRSLDDGMSERLVQISF